MSKMENYCANKQNQIEHISNLTSNKIYSLTQIRNALVRLTELSNELLNSIDNLVLYTSAPKKIFTKLKTPVIKESLNTVKETLSQFLDIIILYTALDNYSKAEEINSTTNQLNSICPPDQDNILTKFVYFLANSKKTYPSLNLIPANLANKNEQANYDFFNIIVTLINIYLDNSTESNSLIQKKICSMAQVFSENDCKNFIKLNKEIAQMRMNQLLTNKNDIIISTEFLYNTACEIESYELLGTLNITQISSTE